MRFSEAEVVLACDSLTETIDFFENRLGFQLTRIFPADDPMSAILKGCGLQIRLQRGGLGPPGSLRLYVNQPQSFSRDQEVLVAPNGTRIEIIYGKEYDHRSFPPPSISLCRIADNPAWKEGRAGMEYRDLIPGRQGGFLIGSHIRVLEGGPLPDYVHSHEVDFQLIYCYRGWVRVVYEEQGEPFFLREGDFVLQPPLIHHRVLECSKGLEVFEIASPSNHETVISGNVALPNSLSPRAKLFSGQAFLRHTVKDRNWSLSQFEGLESCDIGGAKASANAARIFILRRGNRETGNLSYSQDQGLSFFFILQGTIRVQIEAEVDMLLAPADCLVVPSGYVFSLKEADHDFEALQVIMPAQARIKSELN